jgi:hypothetical protein
MKNIIDQQNLGAELIYIDRTAKFQVKKLRKGYCTRNAAVTAKDIYIYIERERER